MAENKNDAFLQRLLATFRLEAQERVQTVASALVALDNAQPGASQQALIETIFREVHSLKGAARAVDKHDIENLCHALETVFSALKRRELVCSRNLVDLLLKASDLLERVLNNSTPADTEQLKTMCAQLHAATANVPNIETLSQSSGETQSVATERNEAPTSRSEISALHETVRIAAARLDALVRQAEGLVALKLSSAQRHIDIATLSDNIGAWKKYRASAADEANALQLALAQNRFDPAQHLPALRKMLDIFGREEMQLKSADAQMSLLRKRSARDAAESALMIDTLLDDMKQASMQPFTALFDLLPKLVRDLARDSGKEVDLVVRGGDIEIDRRILDSIRDPLIHLVRNAIDHGVETPQLRAQKNKPPRARLLVEAAQQDGKIALSIGDDGAGIDSERVMAAAQKLAVAQKLEEVPAVDDDGNKAQRALSLIFESGLSTSATITDISGRGLGLAIVREKIEALGGTVVVTSKMDLGTQFKLTMPLTLATYRGVLVSCGSRQFLFPLVHVERVVHCQRSDIGVVQNREIMNWEGRTLTVVSLSRLLELPKTERRDAAKWPLVIAAAAEQRIAFLVDAVIGEQEVLVKNLGPQLRRVHNIAAAAALADGRVALVLNVLDLFKLTARGSGYSLLENASAAQPKSVLVAEDSITSRQLLRGMLEAAGYRVTVAVDGEDAFAKLRADVFDVLISDVDMPYLSGFDLTARVRADEQLRALPVVLVTSLASNRDRERGIDVGANAYIVKSNFEESNLLDVIRRLI